jgi:hypothetical protein
MQVLVDLPNECLPVRAGGDFKRLDHSALEHHRRRDRLERDHRLAGAGERDRRVGQDLKGGGQAAEEVGIVGSARAKVDMAWRLLEHMFESTPSRTSRMPQALGDWRGSASLPAVS